MKVYEVPLTLAEHDSYIIYFIQEKATMMKMFCSCHCGMKIC